MANFDELLSGLHDNATLNDITADYSTNILEVNEKRIFNPIEMDTIIAYEGDINSQIITIKCPKAQDSHDLSGCEFKELKWKNLSSGVEGISKLKVVTSYENDNNFCVTWEVPSDLCTQAGAIEISIQFYDKKDGTVVFAWNTASYAGLSVAKSMDSVGFEFPAKNEILFIDKDTKNIVAPQGYNNVICNYGDVGVANVYFLVNRYLGKNNNFDILDINTKVFILIKLNGYTLYNSSVIDESGEAQITMRPYTENIDNRINEGLVLLNWAVPETITAGDFGAHNLEISIEFIKTEGEKIKKRWFSNSYSNLEIGQSMFEIDVDPGEGSINMNLVTQMIDKYFQQYEVVFDANLFEEDIEE